MNRLHLTQPSHAPRAPEGVVQRQVQLKRGGVMRSEWFLAGTEPRTDEIPTFGGPDSRIAYPMNRSLLTLESLRPREKLLIQVVAPKADQNLYINGQRLGRAKTFLPWEPRSGKFIVELRDSRGQVVHRVHFEVRGRSFAWTN